MIPWLDFTDIKQNNKLCNNERRGVLWGKCISGPKKKKRKKNICLNTFLLFPRWPHNMILFHVLPSCTEQWQVHLSCVDWSPWCCPSTQHSPWWNSSTWIFDHTWPCIVWLFINFNWCKIPLDKPMSLAEQTTIKANQNWCHLRACLIFLSFHISSEYLHFLNSWQIIVLWMLNGLLMIVYIYLRHVWNLADK